MTISINQSTMNPSIFNSLKGAMFLLILCLMSVGIHAQGTLGAIKLKHSKNQKIKGGGCLGSHVGLKDLASLKPLCPDLEVLYVGYKHIAPRTSRGRGGRGTTAASRGGYQVIAKIKNVGAMDYESNSGQQSIHLYVNNRLVKTLAFTNVARGQEIQITHMLNNIPSNTILKAVISYDPDIQADGNTHNDECSYENNLKQINSSDII